VVKLIPIQPTKAEADESKQEEQTKAANDRIIASETRRLSFFTACLAVIGLIQAMFLLLHLLAFKEHGKQFKEVAEGAAKASEAAKEATEVAREANGIAADNSYATQRAFVSLRELEYIPMAFDKVENLILTPIWYNNGTTTTNNARQYVAYTTTPDNIFANKVVHDIPIVVAPGTSNYGARLEIPVQSWQGARSNERIQPSQYVYVWGWIEYEDILRPGTTHRTEFCYEVLIREEQTSNRDAGYKAAVLHFGLYGEHNRAD